MKSAHQNNQKTPKHIHLKCKKKKSNFGQKPVGSRYQTSTRTFRNYQHLSLRFRELPANKRGLRELAPASLTIMNCFFDHNELTGVLLYYRDYWRWKCAMPLPIYLESLENLGSVWECGCGSFSKCLSCRNTSKWYFFIF